MTRLFDAMENSNTQKEHLKKVVQEMKASNREMAEMIKNIETKTEEIMK